MAIETDSLTQEVEKYKCDANKAVSIKFVHTEEDVLNEEKSFHPWMSHQVFGESETIFGYKGLDIKLYYHAGSLLTYLDMAYYEKVPPILNINPDSVLQNLAEHLPEGFLSNRDEFISRLPEEDCFTPMGNQIHSYKRNGSQFEIYQADLLVPRLRDYHARLQTFILWYIDAASFIDFDDEKWNFFLLFEKQKTATNSPLYNIVGYMTVYHFFAYPNKFRPRISQTLIFPTYQRKGHGAELIETVNRYYVSNPDAVDITVEDPSDDFVRCRDFIDCRNCAGLDEYSKAKLLGPYSDEMRKAALKMFKISKPQARRVYEILRLRSIDKSNSTMCRLYRIDVKNRLNIPYQKQARDLKRLQAVLSSDEYNAAMVGQTREERMQRLDESYQLLEEEYSKVIERLSTTPS